MATSEPKPAGSPAKVDANNNAAAPPAAASESQATVVALANKYRAEFEETFEGLRQRAVKLQSDAPQFLNETQASVEPYKQEFITTVQATGDVTTPPIVVLGTLAWASVLVLASTISMHLSALLLAPILSLAIGTCGALVLALGVIPVYTYWAINKEIEAKSADAKIRFQLLAVALVEGCLAGHILQYSYLSGAPLGALLLGVAAGAYPFAAEKFGGNRQMLLGASVGASAGVTVVLGLLTGYLTMPYLLLSLLYAAATAVCLQYMYKNVANDSHLDADVRVPAVAARLLPRLPYAVPSTVRDGPRGVCKVQERLDDEESFIDLLEDVFPTLPTSYERPLLPFELRFGASIRQLLQ